MRRTSPWLHRRTTRGLLSVLGLVGLLTTSLPGAGVADTATAFVMSEGERQAFKQARVYGVDRRDEFVLWADAYLDKVAERLAHLELKASPTDSSSVEGFASTLRASRMQLQILREAQDSQWITRHRIFSETVDDIERISARLYRHIEPGRPPSR